MNPKKDKLKESSFQMHDNQTVENQSDKKLDSSYRKAIRNISNNDANYYRFLISNRGG